MSPAAAIARPCLMQVVLSLDPGGAERLVIEISKRVQSEMEVVVCCLDREGDWARELRDLGIEVEVLGRRTGFRPSLALRIAALARRRRVRVLHCHQYSPFIYGALASWLIPWPRLVYTEHGRLSDAPASARRRHANRLFGRSRGQFFAVSEHLRESLVAEGFPASRVGVIHNGIDPGPEPDASARSLARSALGLGAADLALATVARLDGVKDLPTMIRAFALLRHGLPAARLVIVGDGPERAELERTAAGEGVAGEVRFLGHRDDVRSLLPAFDLYLNSSIFEGVSVTILEAMAAGLPVVATTVGGTPEVVDEATGVLVPPRAPRRLAKAMAALLHSPERRLDLGAAGRRRVRSRFALDRMVESYLAAYRGEPAVSGG